MTNETTNQVMDRTGVPRCLSEVTRCLKCGSTVAGAESDEGTIMVCTECGCIHGESPEGFYWEFTPEVLKYGNKQIKITQ